VSRRKSFIEDQRGAAALEMPFVWAFLVVFLLLPLADLTIAGIRFISAYQALRDMGQLTQYRPPPSDVTSSSSITSWTSSLQTAYPTVDGYTVSAQVYCGDPGTLAPCASTTTLPKYYTFTTSFTLSPMVFPQSVLCSTCTVSYSQRFQ
jgi:hypothetical protein